MNYDEWVILSKQVSLVIFFLTFVAILFWAFRPANRQRFEQIGKNLLEEDDPPPENK